MTEETWSRPSGRKADELRPIKITRHYTKYAEGSVLIEVGGTKVICTASVEEKVPGWLKDQGKGWVTAEYGMLPRATGTRTDREAAKGKQSGRTQEIQRLIGRSLRAVVEADGGTRCASITGAYVALADAVNWLIKNGSLEKSPLKGQVAALSVGIYEGVPVADFDYDEDHLSDTDMNVVMTDAGKFVELQGTAEGEPFSREDLDALLKLAEDGLKQLFAAQRAALAEE